MSRRVKVIINPAAGHDVPLLSILNSVLRESDVKWDISLTQETGDGARLAQAAAADGVDLVAVYGGDGTVSDVASGLVGSHVPLAILPGGTANVMSLELGVPYLIHEACSLLCDSDWQIQPVDVGQIEDRYFLLRVGIGFEAAMVEGADRTLKHRIGSLAYVLSALHALREPLTSRYQLVLDGQSVEEEGITCIVANSGNLGVSGLSLAPTTQVSDGLLDVFILHEASIAAVMEIIASSRGQTAIEALPELQPELLHHKHFHHWQAREITVHSEPRQSIQVDGEIWGHTPTSMRIIPHALYLLVPQQSSDAVQL